MDQRGGNLPHPPWGNRTLVDPLQLQFFLQNDLLNEFRLTPHYILNPILKKNKHLPNFVYLIVLDPAFNVLFHRFDFCFAVLSF